MCDNRHKVQVFRAQGALLSDEAFGRRQVAFGRLVPIGVPSFGNGSVGFLKKYNEIDRLTSDSHKLFGSTVCRN